MTHNYKWGEQARLDQLPPEEKSWAIWLTVAGRGFGKTRMMAEYIREQARKPNTRILLFSDRLTMTLDGLIEGESGILAVHPESDKLKYLPARRQILWPNGSSATLVSLKDPDSTRGLTGEIGIGDDIDSWSREMYTNARMAIRLGREPHLILGSYTHDTPVIRDIVFEQWVNPGTIHITKAY